MATTPEHWAPRLSVQSTLTPETLDAYFDNVSDRLTKDMAFLRKPIARRYWTSGLLRAAALAALAAGLLLPILLDGRHDILGGEKSGAELALIAVVVGGLILFADQLFNVSRSWSRLMLAEMQVKNVRESLEMQWAKRRPFVTSENLSTEGVALISLLEGALKDANAVMVAQKQAWATELDQATAELRAKLEAQRGSLAQAVEQQREEAARPTTGAVNIVIDDPKNLKGPVKVLVDGTLSKEWPMPAARLSVGSIPAGLRQITIEGERNTAPPTPFTAVQALQVEAGAAATLEVSV